MTDDEIKEAIENIQENNTEEVDRSKWEKFKDWWYQDNGFLNKSNGWYDKAEGHAAGIGIGFFSLAYMLPTPLGEFMVVSFLLMMRTIFKRVDKDLEGHLGDVAHEFAYTIVSATVTVAFFKYYMGYSLKMIDVSQLLITMLGGA